MRVFVILCLFACSLMVSGCGAVSGIAGTISGAGVDNRPQPSRLVKINQQVPIHAVWEVPGAGPIGPDCPNLGPILADNMLFLTDSKGLVLASNPSNGKIIWSTHLKTFITSGPSIGCGIVVVGTNDGKVIALSENKGNVLWRADVFNSVLSAPQIAQGRVIVKTIDGKLFALNAHTGQQLWVYEHGAPTLVMRKDGVPKICGDRVIAGFADGKIAAFNLDNGQLLWEQEIATPAGVSQVEQMVDVVGDPVIGDGVIYVASYQGMVIAVNIDCGEILWQQDISCAGSTDLALGRRLLFATDPQDRLWAIDRATGQIVWQQDVLAYRQVSAPAVMANMLLVGDVGGYLHVFSIEDGHYMARHLVENGIRIIAPPFVRGDIAYVAGENGHLSAWRVGH